jgi:hypothetical protein
MARENCGSRVFDPVGEVGQALGKTCLFAAVRTVRRFDFLPTQAKLCPSAAKGIRNRNGEGLFGKGFF